MYRLFFGKSEVQALAIVAAFAGYGFFGPGFRGQIYDGPFYWSIAIEASVTYGALGFCIATCLVVGLVVSIGVRAHRAERWKAVLVLLASSIATTVLTPLILMFSGLFHGESGMLIYFGAIVAAAVSALSFLAFTICVLCIRRS